MVLESHYGQIGYSYIRAIYSYSKGVYDIQELSYSDLRNLMKK